MFHPRRRTVSKVIKLRWEVWSFASFSGRVGDLGQGKDTDCHALIAQVQNQDPNGLVLKDVMKPSGEQMVSRKRNFAEQEREKIPG